jgi:hypothetical protein
VELETQQRQGFSQTYQKKIKFRFALAQAKRMIDIFIYIRLNPFISEFAIHYLMFFEN